MSDDLEVLSAIADPCCLSRRGLLRAAGVAGAAAVAAPVLELAAPGRALASGSKPHPQSNARTRIVLLGTAGGPLLNTDNYGRRGISTAVVYGDRVYIVDLGHGSLDQLAAAGLTAAGLQNALLNVRGVLFTHLHSDHITEWPAMYMTADSNTGGGQLSEPIHVFGPGARGTLPRVFPPNRPAPAVVNPQDPTPGTVGMTAYLRQAFAQDFNDRKRDSNFPDPDSLLAIHDIDISRYWHVDPAGVPPVLPPGTRIPVWVDGDVIITATLVDHHPTAPAFAFRFDTPDGSIVISGDTAPSVNLIDLAQGVDYLVHEAIDPAWVAGFVATLPPAVQGPVREHLLGAHTSLSQVGQVAQRARAKNLVLTHLVPANIPAAHFKQTRQNFSGRVFVGEDLMRLGIRTHARRG